MPGTAIARLEQLLLTAVDAYTRVDETGKTVRVDGYTRTGSVRGLNRVRQNLTGFRRWGAIPGASFAAKAQAAEHASGHSADSIERSLQSMKTHGSFDDSNSRAVYQMALIQRQDRDQRAEKASNSWIGSSPKERNLAHKLAAETSLADLLKIEVDYKLRSPRSPHEDQVLNIVRLAVLQLITEQKNPVFESDRDYATKMGLT